MVGIRVPAEYRAELEAKLDLAPTVYENFMKHGSRHAARPFQGTRKDQMSPYIFLTYQEVIDKVKIMAAGLQYTLLQHHVQLRPVCCFRACRYSQMKDTYSRAGCNRTYMRGNLYAELHRMDCDRLGMRGPLSRLGTALHEWSSTCGCTCPR